MKVDNPIEYVGAHYTNNQGVAYTVLSYDGMNHNNQRTYTIQFDDSKFVRHGITLSNMNKGSVKDYFAPIVHGVGALGFARKKDNLHAYHTWASMLERCYKENCPSYKWYGADGVTVCERWKRFDYFLEDLPTLPGYDEEQFRLKQIKLDKDIRIKGSKIYSPETCCFVSHSDNMKDAFARYNSEKSRKIAVFPDGHEELVLNLTDFCAEHNINYRYVYHRLNDDQKVDLNGFHFYYEKGVTTIPRRCNSATEVGPSEMTVGESPLNRSATHPA